MKKKNFPEVMFVAFLNQREANEMWRLAELLDMQPSNILRTAFRMYQSDKTRQDRGEKQIWVDAEGKPIPELSMLPPNLDE